MERDWMEGLGKHTSVMSTAPSISIALVGTCIILALLVCYPTPSASPIASYAPLTKTPRADASISFLNSRREFSTTSSAMTNAFGDPLWSSQLEFGSEYWLQQTRRY